MRISIVVVSKGIDKGVLSTLTSIVAQTSTNYECTIVEVGLNSYINKPINSKYQIINIDEDSSFFKACNVGIESTKGEYFLFLKAGDYLTNDRVLEELILNKLDADIIFANTIVKTELNTEKHIFIPEDIKASDLILNSIPFQSVLFKRTLFSENKLFNENLVFSSIHLFIIESLLVNKKSFKHINLFLNTISTYEDDNNELRTNLIQILPYYADDYFNLGEYRKEASDEHFKVLNKFGKSVFFNIIWAVKQFAEKKGYYKLKAKIKQKIYYKKLNKSDKLKRKEVTCKINTLPENILIRKNDKSDIIVSLTSFGKRVEDSAPYAIYSLFNQKSLPNRIILFLDYNNWNENNIPPILRKLQKSGLEIMFCEDLKPYKKLIPALKLFPENVIITVDDDVYYNDATLSELLDVFDKSDKKSVICHWAFIAEKRNGKFIPYSQWKDNKFWNYESFLSPIGQDGILYSPGIFDEDIIKSELFMELCPNADDIWFWIQEYRNQVKIELVRNSSKNKNLFVNTVEQWAPTKKSALYYMNVIGGRNDINLKNLLAYYKIQ